MSVDLLLTHSGEMPCDGVTFISSSRQHEQKHIWMRLWAAALRPYSPPLLPLPPHRPPLCPGLGRRCRVERFKKHQTLLKTLKSSLDNVTRFRRICRFVTERRATARLLLDQQTCSKRSHLSVWVLQRWSLCRTASSQSAELTSLFKQQQLYRKAFFFMQSAAKQVDQNNRWRRFLLLSLRQTADYWLPVLPPAVRFAYYRPAAGYSAFNIS